MEVTKRFLWFLQELENPSVQKQYTAGELNEYLKQIREKLGQISAEDNSDASPVASLEELGLLEQTILDTCEGIYVKLKDTLDHLCRMHVHATNFPLDSLNLIKFLTVYCNALFESTKISLLSEDPQAPSFLKMVDGETSGNETQHQELIMELERYMDDQEIRTLDLEDMPLLEGLLENKDYLGNIAFKIDLRGKPLYLILHFKNDSPFTGYFIAGNHYKTYPLCLEFISTAVDTATRKLYAENKDEILRSIETIMIEIIQLQKNYFLSFVASEVRTALCCDVPTSLNIVEEESKTPTKTGVSEKAKSIEITLLQHNRLEIRANFDWNNAKLNTQLSAIWGKLQGLAKVQEERNYYRTQLKATNSVFLQFSQKGTLIYQSDVLPEEYNSIVEINNFLAVPTARSMSVALSKNKKFFLMIQDLIRICQESKSLVPAKDVEFENVHFTFVCKRNEWNKTFDGFCLAFDKFPAPKETTPNEGIENIILDLERNDSTKRMKSTLKKMKVFLGHQPSQDATSVLGANMDLEKLKSTIVSEYLPEELTRGNSDSIVASKAISAVRKIKIEMTPGTAFRQLGDSPPTRFASFAITKANSNPVELMRKTDKFTRALLSNGRKDTENMANWSFDISAIPDWTEKSRLVWVILNQTNLVKEYNIELNKLCEFVSQIKDGYTKNNNPYHNYDHGISVMHATNYIMKNLSTRFSSLVNLGMLVAAFCHDVDHTGKNNNFEVNSGSELAIRYHDRAVLEQHHAAVTFQILNKEACNIFSQIKKEDRKELRKLIISNILATDMKEHFEIMKNFRELNTRTKAVLDDSFVYSNDDIQLLTGMIVHCADLSGPTKDFPLSFKWATKVNEEFSTQVREEAALDIPITPYFKDLEKKHVMAKQEIAFISFMIKPVWELFDDFCAGSMKVATNNIEKNLKEWNIILETALKQVENEKPAIESEKPAEDKIKQEPEQK